MTLFLLPVFSVVLLYVHVVVVLQSNCLLIYSCTLFTSNLLSILCCRFVFVYISILACV